MVVKVTNLQLQRDSDKKSLEKPRVDLGVLLALRGDVAPVTHLPNESLLNKVSVSRSSFVTSIGSESSPKDFISSAVRYRYELSPNSSSAVE